MATTTRQQSGRALLYGRDDAAALVALEHRVGRGDHPDTVTRFQRTDRGVETVSEPFHPYLWLADRKLLKGFDAEVDVRTLDGDLDLSLLAVCPNSAVFQQLLKHLKKSSGESVTSPQAPYFALSDRVEQYGIHAGATLFKNLPFGRLRRMQLDIETYTEAGFEFSNPERDGDRVIAVAMSDHTGWIEILSGAEYEEPEMLRRMVEMVRERDPDVIEGHNIFNFDLPFLRVRAARHGVKLNWGRDGSEDTVRPSRFSAGERTIGFTRSDIRGRHIVDTYFLAQLYDVSQRALPGFGLKEVARHFGAAADDRTYVDGPEIARVFDEDPDRLMRYAADDVRETEAVAAVLSPVYFAQSQVLPFSYQNICLRGNASKIDALMLRAYYSADHGIPRPEPGRAFAGGYTDIFYTGVARDVHHCDVQSLYPSLMLSKKIGPANDPLDRFLELLDALKTVRFEAKDRLRGAKADADRLYWNAMQSTYKILINSFYGYLGFSQARFNDFDAAENITAEGRALLRNMIDWIRQRGGQPIEIDTDGIYFIPPEGQSESERETFEQGLQDSLPEGIEVEFDGRYRAMFSYKMKNYALLEDDGAVTIKGAALKSRGLELFQRRFMEDILRLLLEDRAADIPALKEEYEQCIRDRLWPIRELSKTETLQEAPSRYEEKIRGKSRGRNAAYELALQSDREYRAGDQISYYVSGDRKNVAVYEAARPVAEWRPERRDENVPYYLAKLDALYDKFKEWIPAGQGELDLFGGE